MDDIQIKLSALWVVLMLTYFLGDVLRIFSGDFVPGEIGGMQVSQTMFLGMAILMVIPIVMVFLFNLVGLPTYPSAYDKFLLVVGLVFNVLTVWYAWKWV